tara:strand:- start:1216 stop:1608 length:393 start_codon:yes stop_codon:yes gene_type:complete
MAKWINFPVINGADAAGVADAAMDGDNLLLADTVLSISTNVTATAMAVVCELVGGKTATALVATSTSDAPNAAVPASTGYQAKLKQSVNRALTANPGGVKATCGLPQDQADATAAYDPALKVYFRSFVVA